VDEQTGDGPVAKTFITAEGLLRDSFALAARILDSGFRPSFLVAVWRGGAPIGIAVQEYLEYRGVPTDHVAIRTSSYAGIDRPEKIVRVHSIDYLVSRLGHEDRLLLIDDVFDSGRSLEALVDELGRRCRRNLPQQMRIATVYYKPARNRSRLLPDYYVHRTDRWLVFPHELQGLSDEEIRRHKPWAQRMPARPGGPAK
jgi:hypoxanthine phosphoribosyltransferase